MALPAVNRFLVLQQLMLLLVVFSVFAESIPVVPLVKVRSISVHVRDIFDDKDLGFPYSTVNDLKMTTIEDVIRRELLFNVGDVYDEFLLEESERRLRTLRYLREVTIISNVDGADVDIVVSVQDTWTIIPQANVSMGGGANKNSVGIGDSNLFGLGKRLEMLYADDEGRETYEVVWDDPRFMATEQQLVLGLFERSDGYRTVGYFGRPLRTLAGTFSWQLNTDFSDVVERMFKSGEEDYIFRKRHQAMAAGMTFSVGEPSDSVERFSLGYEFLNDVFNQADLDDFNSVNLDPNIVSADLDRLADDRRFSGPFVEYNYLEPRYVALDHVDRFERTEDFNLGRDIKLRLGYAPEFLDSYGNTILSAARYQRGWKLSASHFLRQELSCSTRTQHDRFNNTILRGNWRYYDVLGERYIGNVSIGSHTLASSLLMDYGLDLDEDAQFVLGAENGLRGYKSRMFTGTSRLLLNLEDRIHLAEDVLKLVSFGTVLFFDIGGAAGSAPGEILTDHLYSDAGIGLRLGFPRSSGGSVLRLDLAFPMRSSPVGDSDWQLRMLVTSGQAFSASLPGEKEGIDKNTSTSLVFSP